jgi:glycosyltransferase involved in cell wall biosynthesis
MPGFKQYPELPNYYGLASAFVLPSISETWGLVVNEAMASGLPVLVSDRCGCAPDLVRDGTNGFTFDPYSVEEIASAMLRVWKMEDGELKRMGAESSRIIAAWGPERFVSGLELAVVKALESGPRAAKPLDRLLLRALISCGKST